MFIRNLSLSSISKYQERERLYAKHLARQKRRFNSVFFDWIKTDRLHDATFAQLQLDETNSSVALEFHYVGEWITEGNGGKPIRPPTRRLVLDFTNVSRFSINATKTKSLSVLGAVFIISELNSHPSIRGHRNLNSLTIGMGGKSEFEIEIIFLAAKFRELEPF